VPADTSWTFEPGAILMIALLGGAYGARFRRVRARDGARAAPTGRAVSFATGLLVLVVALVSPVDRLAEQSFFMHMLQHVLLLDVAPIALLCGLTKVILRPLTRRLRPLEEAAGPLAHPAVGVVVYVAATWLWHVPAFYDAALERGGVHVLEHVSFLNAGLLYWWFLLAPVRPHVRMGPMGPVIYMLSTKVLVGALGIAITFAPGALYGFYERRAPIWGLEATEDQALAGGLMALEQSIVMGIALVFLFVRALGESTTNERRAERYAR
jgi:putative membrane protein